MAKAMYDPWSKIVTKNGYAGESIALYLIVTYNVCLYGIHRIRFCIFRKKTFFHMLSLLKIVLDIYYLYIYNYTIFKRFVKHLETYIHN